MRAMMIGLGPEYNYPGDYATWRRENTRYASNHGASLISRSIAKEFSADYIDNFDNIDELKEKYDTCFIAFATHLTTWRDVSEYADIVEKLNMKTIALSLGVQDYMGSMDRVFKIHPSLKRLLTYISDRSGYVGVRGHYSASLLYKNGFRNVVPTGCPTMYWRMENNMNIQKPEKFENPILVYQKTVAGFSNIINNATPVGQDFIDEPIFTDRLKNDTKLYQTETEWYAKQSNSKEILGIIESKGVFHETFQEWFDFVNQSDFVVGPRLHGCIAGLLLNKPAVMLARDVRVNEIAEFYNIPKYTYTELKDKSVADIFEEADYSAFNKTHAIRYSNYLKFLADNDIYDHNLKDDKSHEDYVYTRDDLIVTSAIVNQDIQSLKLKMEEMERLDSMTTSQKIKNRMKSNKTIYSTYRRIKYGK